jgi:hypothetical protein
VNGTTVNAMSTLDAAREASVSLRQVDYWQRTGLVECETAGRSGPGMRRVWTPEQVAMLRVLGRVASALGQLDRAIAERIVEQLRPLPLTWWPEEIEVEVDAYVVVHVRTGKP